MPAYRQIAAEQLGRPLAPGEVVHHIDGRHSNDAPENLQVMDGSTHSHLHRQLRCGDRERTPLPEVDAVLGCNPPTPKAAPAKQEDGVLVGTVTKSAVEEVRVYIRSYEGHEYVDCRVWATAIGNHIKAAPTKKGLCLSWPAWHQLFAVILGAQDGDRASLDCASL